LLKKADRLADGFFRNEFHKVWRQVAEKQDKTENESISAILWQGEQACVTLSVQVWWQFLSVL
jgi:hypothetical protein